MRPTTSGNGPKCEVPTASSKVRFPRRTGRHLLALSSSHFDPLLASSIWIKSALVPSRDGLAWTEHPWLRKPAHKGVRRRDRRDLLGADHVRPLSVGNLGVNSEFPINFPDWRVPCEERFWF